MYLKKSGKDIRYKDAISGSQSWDDAIRTYFHTSVTDADLQRQQTVEDNCEDGSTLGPNLYGNSMAAFHRWAVGFKLVNI